MFDSDYSQLDLSMHIFNATLVGLVNKPNIFYQFENLLKYGYETLRKLDIVMSDIVRLEFLYQPKIGLIWYDLSENYVILMIFS